MERFQAKPTAAHVVESVAANECVGRVTFPSSRMNRFASINQFSGLRWAFYARHAPLYGLEFDTCKPTWHLVLSLFEHTPQITWTLANHRTTPPPHFFPLQTTQTIAGWHIYFEETICCPSPPDKRQTQRNHRQVLSRLEDLLRQRRESAEASWPGPRGFAFNVGSHQKAKTLNLPCG